MIEIRLHGRGGQGAVSVAQILAIAAHEDGYYSQAFPMYGSERRGSPVVSFVRIDKKPINLRSQVYEPDYVIILDPSLVKVVDVKKGLKPKGEIMINSNNKICIEGFTTFCTDISEDAKKILGANIVNTGTAALFIAITKIISLESLKKAISKKFPEEIAKKNILLVETVYNKAGKVNK